jgi:large subunit ribosomal protein L15
MPAIREQLKKLPKRRGRGINALRSIQDKPSVVNVSLLEKFFSAGDAVNPKVLMERGAVRSKGAVKILGDGELTKKLTVSGCLVSGQARAKIEKAGGTIAA